MKTIFGLIIVATLFSCNSTSNEEQELDKLEQAAQMQEQNIAEESIDYLTEGKQIAGEAQATLGKNLMNAINSKGTKYAVEFCNIEAMKITDSMATLLNASIKRVTDQPRNSKNQANAVELKNIQVMKDQIAKGEMPNPLLTESDGRMIGYYAIMTNSMCLNCHGEKNITIESETYDKIKALYPSDKATGYGENQLRGMWVVEMDKK